MGRSLHIAMIAVLSLLAIHCLSEGSAEWTTTIFEDAISIERTPDHINERAPFNGESMFITIESRTAQIINAADVRLTWNYEGRQNQGGYQFDRINQTAMSVEIPGYPGGYTIQYYLVAYDEKNHPLQSTTYSYTVQKNGSWSGSDFDTNIVLTWGPMAPRNGESVTMNITSRANTVSINRADLLYSVNMPDMDPLDGVAYFDRINSTAMTVTLLPYPAGSTISYYIDAYDSYYGKIRSDSITYKYPAPPVIGPVYLGYLFVVLTDDAEGLPANGALVTFSNETYSYEMESVNGLAFTNETVYQGEYRIEIEYKGERTVRTVSVPRVDGSFTFQYEINKKSYAVAFDDEERPLWRELAGIVVICVALSLTILGALQAKKIRERLAEKKKKSRKRTDMEEETLMERIFKDEEKKTLIIRTAAFALLSLLGLSFAPFYPWWMILLLAAVLTGVSLRFPYVSLLVMAVLVTAAAAYQSREFGWVFLVFSLAVMVGGFFDWKYAYLSYLTVFAAGLGFGFSVPLIAVVGFSLFMGTIVFLTAAVFLLIVAPSGNFVWFSFLSSPSHDKSFVTFSRGVDPHWSPVDVANEIGGLSYVDMNILSTVLSDTMTSLVPLFGIIGMGLGMLAAFFIFKKVKRSTDWKQWAAWTAPGIIVMLVSVISMIWAGNDVSFWTIMALLGCLPASVLAFTVRAFGEEALPFEYGVTEIKSSEVGKRISDMVGLRKATFKDIGGLEEVKREVKNSLMVPLLEPEMALKFGVKPSKGILLFGPPGCGKTLMLRAVASDLNVDMIGIKCSDVMSKWYGESENLIASLFEEARARSPCILFLDEIDAIAKRRDFYSTDDVTPRVLSIMLSEMDGMDESEGIIIVATTNMPDLVDPALMRPGRFDKVIYVPPPDRVSREEILKVHLKGKYVAKDIDVEELARRTDGFSGADLANLVREASSLGLERALETKEPQPITMDDMRSILDEIKPSVTPKMIEMYSKLRAEFERKRKGKGQVEEEAEEFDDEPEDA